MKRKRLTMSKSKSWQKLARHLVQMGRLLEQGYPLHTAISFLILHVQSDVKNQLNQVLIQLKEGHPVHEAFQFLDLPPMFKSFLYFYEQQGEIAQGFIQAGMLLEKREKMKEEFMKLLRYPLFLLWLCLLLLILMYYLVVPHFQSFFSMVEEAPRFTNAVFIFIEHTPYVVAVISTIFAAVALYYFLKMKSWSSYEKVRKLLYIPYVGNYVRTMITYYFSLQLGRLLDVGLSLQEALRLFAMQDYIPFFQQECVKLMHELQQGRPLAQLLHDRIYLNTDLAFVVENGEKTGYLAKDLVHYSEMLYRNLDEWLLKALRFIQPVFFLFIGGIVFMLFLATMLPLFQMIGAL